MRTHQGPLALSPWCRDFACGLVSFNGHQQEQVCDHCAWKRDRITNCPNHQTAPLKGLSSETFDFKAPYDNLILGPVGKRIETNQWCSVCSSAIFQCATEIRNGVCRDNIWLRVFFL
ncbi:hypothetical protein BDW72DRAFT_178808 [Aspergillus terricola var. indicus]